MSKHNKTYNISVVGIDLAKSSFQLHAIDENGNVLFRKKLTKLKLKEFMIQLPVCLVGMEACGSAHYWARLLQSYGHTVKLMAPQFVKPYVKSNKNDAADAEAICEAVQRPNMRFVSVKSISQQDLQSLHRARSICVANKTKQINQIRGLLLEYGIDIPRGPNQVMAKLPIIIEDADNGLSFMFRELINKLFDELKHTIENIKKFDEKVTLLAKESEVAENLQTIPGVGPLTATAIIAAIGTSVANFKSGRELAAWLGLVPKQSSTGGRDKLLGISKRGDIYLRMLLVHGARSAIRFVEKKTDPTSQWIKNVIGRRHKNIATVALANKMVRIIYAIIKNGTKYHQVECNVA